MIDQPLVIRPSCSNMQVMPTKDNVYYLSCQQLLTATAIRKI